MSEVSFNQLTPGDRVSVSGYRQGNKAYRQRLLAMGLTPNTPITFVRRAPMGDPVQLRVRNCELSLRQEEAALLILLREETACVENSE